MDLALASPSLPHSRPEMGSFWGHFCKALSLRQLQECDGQVYTFALEQNKNLRETHPHGGQESQYEKWSLQANAFKDSSSPRRRHAFLCPSCNVHRVATWAVVWPQKHHRSTNRTKSSPTTQRCCEGTHHNHCHLTQKSSLTFSRPLVGTARAGTRHWDCRTHTPNHQEVLVFLTDYEGCCYRNATGMWLINLHLSPNSHELRWKSKTGI